jgi:hypothetical protein
MLIIYGITHVFGCYEEEKISLLGFKCRSDIIKLWGEAVGTPFIFRDFGKKLHCLKIKIDKKMD